MGYWSKIPAWFYGLKNGSIKNAFYSHEGRKVVIGEIKPITK